MKALLIAAALAVAGTASAQMCPGDQDGSRSVTVDEILATVNASLNGCVAPEYACPYSLASYPDKTLCLFIGHGNDLCRGSEISGLLTRDRPTGDVAAMVTDGTNSVFFIAELLDGSTSMAGLKFVSVNQGPLRTAEGLLYLNGEATVLDILVEGRTLSDIANVRLDGCPLRHFVGVFEREVPIVD